MQQFKKKMEDSLEKQLNENNSNVKWRCMKTIEDCGGKVIFSRDGKFIIQHDRRKIQAWSTYSGTLLWKIRHYKRINSVALSGDGKMIVSGSNDKLIKISKIKNGALIQTLHSKHRINSVSFSEDNKYIVSGTLRGHICIWSIVYGRALKTFFTRRCIMDAHLTPNNKNILYSSGVGDNIYLIRCKTKRESKIKHMDNRAFEILKSSNGNFFVTGSKKVIMLSSHGNILKTFDDAGSFDSISLSTDSKFLLLFSDDSIRIWSFISSKMYVFKRPIGIWSVDISPDACGVIMANNSRTYVFKLLNLNE